MDLVQMVSTRFISAGTSGSRSLQMLPLPLPSERRGRGGIDTLPSSRRRSGTPSSSRSPRSCWQTLAPRAAESEIFSALLEGVGLVLHRPAASHGGGDRERRRARPHPDPRHEPRPSGLHHHRDHGNRWRRRGAPPVEGSLTAMTTTASQDTVPAGTLEDGRVVSIAGPVIDVEFPPHALPEINHAVEFTIELDGATLAGHGRGGPADRRRPGALHLHAADRRPGAGHAGAQPRAGHHRSRRQRRARPRVQRAGPAARHRSRSRASTTTGRSTAARRRSTSSSPGP